MGKPKQQKQKSKDISKYKTQWYGLTLAPKFNGPRQVLNKMGVFQQEFSINISKNDNNYKDFIDDVIVEYKEYAGKEETYKHDSGAVYTYSYLQSYLSVGIPTVFHNRIMSDVNFLYRETGKKVASLVDNINHNYAWHTVDMDSDLPCNIYSKQVDGLLSVGPLFDIVTQLKSNVSGIGRFKIYVLYHEESDTHFLKFTLTGFQLVKETQTQSVLEDPYLFTTTELSDELKSKLEISTDN